MSQELERVGGNGAASRPARVARRVYLDAVYDLRQAREVLGVAKTCLPRAIRKGHLRASRRGGKYLILGEWLLEWVRGGEVKRYARAAGQTSEQKEGGS
jgi:hypothetical protein